VLGGHRVARKPVDAARDALDICATFKLHEAHLMQSGRRAGYPSDVISQEGRLGNSIMS
jgi:hypothetical protein